MRTKAPLLILAALLIVLACSDGDEKMVQYDATGPSVVYFSSFESADDTVGWYGLMEEQLTDNAAPGCGSRSASFSGGCEQPAAFMYLYPRVAGYYVMSCWGKVENGLPQIALRTHHLPPEDSDWLYIRIGGDEWSYYETADSLYCSAEDSLVLQILHGGIVPVPPVLIDCLTIERLDQ